MQVRWLLIDSCGAVATLAVGRGRDMLASAELEGHAFSAGWPGALRRLLEDTRLSDEPLDLIGVVSGPGSFTGVRVGLALAKGLCEAMGARLVTVSRLEMLQASQSPEALAIIDAGRGEYYVRDGERERLVGREEMALLASGRTVAIFEGTALAGLQEVTVGRVTPRADSAAALLLSRWDARALDEVATAEANYVRGERDIYATGKASV